MRETENVPAPDPAPTIIKGKVTPRRPTNAAVRPREYLTPNEVDRLLEAARRRGRYGHRDATMVRPSFYILRGSEI